MMMRNVMRGAGRVYMNMGKSVVITSQNALFSQHMQADSMVFTSNTTTSPLEEAFQTKKTSFAGVASTLTNYTLSISDPGT